MGGVYRPTWRPAQARKHIFSKSAGGQQIAVGQALETDTAFSIGRKKEKAIGLVTSTESAFTITRLKTRTLGLTVETDSAFAITSTKRKEIGLATETETAFPITATESADAVGQQTPFPAVPYYHS